MAGDWLKLEINTPDKPEVIGMADMLGILPQHVLGSLFMVWRWFDQHTTEGNASYVTKVTIDRLSGVTGFADAMQKVGWLIVDAGHISLPNFDRHNGETAKQRGLTAKRVAKSKAKSNAQGNAEVTEEALPREEKRREELKPLSSTSTTSRFDDFWKAFPPSPRKVAKITCQKKWVAKKLDSIADKILKDVADKANSQQWRDGFAPAPLTYINQERWGDGVPVSGQPVDWKANQAFSGLVPA